jgi:hypothetical protein
VACISHTLVWLNLDGRVAYSPAATLIDITTQGVAQLHFEHRTGVSVAVGRLQSRGFCQTGLA